MTLDNGRRIAEAETKAALISVSVAGVQMETLLLDRLFGWISEVVVVGF